MNNILFNMILRRRNVYATLREKGVNIYILSQITKKMGETQFKYLL